MPTLENVQRVASAMHVTIDYLATGKDKDGYIVPKEVKTYVEKISCLSKENKSYISKTIDMLLEEQK